MQFAIGIGRNETINEIGDHARVAEECGFKYLRRGGHVPTSPGKLTR